MREKIKYFPITAFAVVMGLSGMSIAFSKFYHMQWFPSWVFELSAYFVLGLFIIISTLYGLKIVTAYDEFIADFKHRIRINFFSAFSISLLLLSILFYSYFPLLAVPLWWLGVALHTFFMYKTISFWIQHNFEIHHFNPAWFIPVVGNILIPVAGIDFAPTFISWFYFSAGFFFWIVLFTIFFYRAIFHAQLPDRFIPTFFILLAPPAVGFIAYIRITASWDAFALFLLLLTYFFVILIGVMYKSFYKIKFFMSWWAFTFPLAASSIASVAAYQISGMGIFAFFAWVLLVMLLAAISIVTLYTVKYASKGEICVKED